MEGQPSQTALQVAAARAAHLRCDPAPHMLADEQAAALLGPDGEEMIESYGEHATRLLRENRLFIPFRARYAEDRLADAYRSGTRQLVVLGAGLDSYAFRRPEDQRELRIYEVDHPSTQGWKLARITELGWETPPALRFAGCDFEQEGVPEALARTDFDSGAPAFVTWLGVVYYLERPTAAAALADLGALLAPGSEVVIDYMRPADELSAFYREQQAVIDAYLEQVGELQHNRYRAEEIREEILASGFRAAHVEDREALRARYFAPLGSSIGMSERFGVAVALR